MPTYSVKVSGKTYSFDGPAGLPNEDVYATIQAGHPDAFGPVKDKPFSDFGSYMAQGALGSTQNVFDVTGVHNPASEWMGRKQESIQFSPAEQARQQRAAEIKKEAEGKGMVAGGLAALHAFGTDWKSLTGQAIGSLAPVAAPLLAAGAAAVAAPELALAAGVGTLAEAGSAALGLAMGAGGMKRGMYQAVKDTLTEHGIDSDKAEEAATKASEYTGPNAAYIAGGGLLGVIDSVTGVGNRAANALATRVAAKVVGKEAAEKAAVATGEKVAGEAAGKAASQAVDTDAKKKAEEKLGHALLKDMVKEAGTEAGENAFQQVGQNVAQTNAGVETPLLAGVGEQAVEGAIGGGLAGGLATGVLHGVNRGSNRLFEAVENQRKADEAAATAAATATPLTEAAKTYKAYAPNAISDADAENIAKFTAAEEARKAGQPPPGSPTGDTLAGVQPVVRGTEPNLQGAGRDLAAAGVAGKVAEPATGGLAGVEPSVRGFERTESFDDRPLKEQKAERKANPITLADVKTGLDTFVADNNLGITVPDPFARRVMKAANDAHLAGEPKTLAELIEQVTPKFEPPKDIGQTVLTLQPAIAQLGGLPAGVTLSPADVQTIHDQLVTGRGLVTPAKALDNVVTAKVQALEAPPVAPVAPVAPVNPVAEQSHANMEAPPEVSSKPPVDTAIGEKTVADADIKAQVDPASIPGTETKKAELADAIAADQASPDPVLTPETKAATEQGVAQGMDPAIPLAEINKAKAEQAQEAPPPVAPVAEAPPALTEPSATTADEAQQAQEPVSEPANEAEPPLPANLAAMMPGEGAPAAVPGEAPVAPEAGAGEAAPAAALGELPISGDLSKVADELHGTPNADMDNPGIVAAGESISELNSDNIVANEAQLSDASDKQMADHEAAVAAAEAAKPPMQSRARKQETIDALEEHPVVAKNKAKIAGEKVSDRKGNTTKNTEEASDALGDGIRTHDEAIVDGLEQVGPPGENKIPALYDIAPTPVFEKMTDPLLTSRIVKMFEGALPHLRHLYRIIGQSQGFRVGLLRGFDKIGKAFKGYVRKYGSVELADAMSITKSMRHDPTKFASREDALLNDPAIVRTEAAMQDPKFQNKGGKAQKVDRDAIRRRKAEINHAWDAWDKLGTQEGGHEMYARIKDFHKYTSDMVKFLRDKTVKSIGMADEAAAERLSQFINSQMDPESFTAKNGRDITYRHVPAGEMPSVYFPTKRYGTFWIGVKEGPSGREYYQYETYSQREAALKRLAEFHGKSPDDKEFFSTGNDRTKLRESMTKESAVVHKIMREVENYPINGKTPEIRAKQIERLKDAVFQSYLQSLPDRSLSKNMIHYEDITGASTDILRNFGTVSRQLANLMTTLKYGAQADNLFRSAAEYLRPTDESPGPYDRHTTEKLEYLLNKVHERLQLAVNPPVRNGLLDKIITIGNRMGVIWYMSSAGTAFANMTAIPVRVAPRLIAEHGVRAIPMLMKLLDVTDTLSLKGDEGHWAMPNIRNSAYVKSNPALKAMMQLGQQWGVFESSYDPMIGTKASGIDTPAKVAAEAGRLVAKGATIGIAATETISREQTFAAAAMLQLPNELKKGGSVEDAYRRAAEYASNTVDDTIGQFSAAQYPKFIQEGVGRALFLFKRFSFIQSDFMTGSVYNILRSMTGMAKGPERALNAKLFAQATGELAMSLGMVTFFAGLAGLPMYSMIMGLLDWKDDKFLTPAEKVERIDKYGDAAFSTDLRLRYHYLPQWLGHATMLGPDGFRHSLANVVMNGPFSELTDANVGSRVSIDHLWFRGFQQGSNLGEVGLNTLVANIANVSLASNMLNGLGDIQNGEATRGMEKLMPAGLKGLFTDYRYMTEGARTRSQATMLKPEDFTLPNLITTAGGLQPTKLGTIQEARIDIQKFNKEATDRRNKVMSEFKKGVADYDRDPSIMKKFFDDMDKYNEKYPMEEFVITDDTIKDAIMDITRSTGRSYLGTTITKKNYGDILPTIAGSDPVSGGLPSDYAPRR
jgi:hypothetical protein